MTAIVLPKDLVDALFQLIASAKSSDRADDAPITVEEVRQGVEQVLNALLPVNADQIERPIVVVGDATSDDFVYESGQQILHDILDAVFGDVTVTINLVLSFELPKGANVFIMETV